MYERPLPPRCGYITNGGKPCKSYLAKKETLCINHIFKDAEKEKSTLEYVGQILIDDTITATIPYKDLLFIGTFVGNIYYWNTVSVTLFSSHCSSVINLLIHNDELYSSYDNGIIRRWDISHKHCFQNFSCEQGYPCSVFIYNDMLYCSTRSEGDIRCWDLDTSQLFFHRKNILNYDNPYMIEFNNLIYGSLNNKIIVMNAMCDQLKTFTVSGCGVSGFCIYQDFLLSYSSNGLIRKYITSAKRYMLCKKNIHDVCCYKDVLYVSSPGYFEELQPPRRLKVIKRFSSVLCASDKYLFTTDHKIIKIWRKLIPSIKTYHLLNEGVQEIVFTFALVNIRLRLMSRDIFNEIISHL